MQQRGDILDPRLPLMGHAPLNKLLRRLQRSGVLRKRHGVMIPSVHQRPDVSLGRRRCPLVPGDSTGGFKHGEGIIVKGRAEEGILPHQVVAHADPHREHHTHDDENAEETLVSTPHTFHLHGTPVTWGGKYITLRVSTPYSPRRTRDLPEENARLHRRF